MHRQQLIMKIPKDTHISLLQNNSTTFDFSFCVRKMNKIQIGQSVQLPMSTTLFSFTSTQTEKCYEMNTPVFFRENMYRDKVLSNLYIHIQSTDLLISVIGFNTKHHSECSRVIFVWQCPVSDFWHFSVQW